MTADFGLTVGSVSVGEGSGTGPGETVSDRRRISAAEGACAAVESVVMDAERGDSVGDEAEGIMQAHECARAKYQEVSS
jgi:hypothetical protein